MNTESPILTTVSTLTSFSSVAGDVAPVLAGSEVEGEFLPGYMCYGVPVGSREYVRHVLNEKVEQAQAQVCGEWGWCSLWEEAGDYKGGGELGNGETGPGGG